MTFNLGKVTAMSTNTKKCTVCGKFLPKDLFYKRVASEDGKAYRCKPCDREAGTAYRKRHKERDRKNRRDETRRRKYGLSEEGYNNILSSQDGKCSICSQTVTHGWSKNHDKHRACIDHCHETGVVRGILCSMCNKGIGLLGDNVGGLEKALAYLKRVT